MTPPFNKRVFYKFIIASHLPQAVRYVTKQRIFDVYGSMYRIHTGRPLNVPYEIAYRR